MIYLLWAAVTFLTLIIQGSFSLFDVAPNFTVVLAYYAGIKKREIKGMFLGALVGIVEDSISGTFLGPNLLSKGLIGYLSSFIYSRFFIWTPLLGIISISLLTIVDSLVVFIAKSVFDRMPMGIGAAIFVILVQSLINALFGAFIKPAKEAEQRISDGHQW